MQNSQADTDIPQFIRTIVTTVFHICPLEKRENGNFAARTNERCKRYNRKKRVMIKKFVSDGNIILEKYNAQLFTTM